MARASQNKLPRIGILCVCVCVLFIYESHQSALELVMWVGHFLTIGGRKSTVPAKMRTFTIVDWWWWCTCTLANRNSQCEFIVCASTLLKEKQMCELQYDYKFYLFAVKYSHDKSKSRTRISLSQIVYWTNQQQKQKLHNFNAKHTPLGSSHSLIQNAMNSTHFGCDEYFTALGQ